MNKAIVATLALISLAVAKAEEKAPPPVETKLLKAEYTIYAGELGEQQAPTRSERKLSIEVTGLAAKEIFDSIYPDAKVTCSEEKGERLRRKKNLWCIYQPDDGYRCFLGFDLRTGDSIPGGSC
jgi:hypothetical protein